MKHTIRCPAAPPELRAALAAAAFAVTTGVLATVALAFHHVSREPFLRDTAQARAAVARCDALGERGQRQRCVEQLVAAAKASDAGTARVAVADAP